MPDLVALDLPAGPAFVDALRRVWDRGDAALPLDQRLPAPARSVVLAAMAPATIIGRGPDGEATEAPWRDGAPRRVETGDALVVATSGTTGIPKGVVLTHDALGAHARAVHRHLGVDPARDRWLACLPLSHMGGLGVVTRCLVTGTGLDVLAGFDAEVVGRAPAERGTTLVSLVATALDRVDPTGFRWVVLGGSADPAERPANVVRTYGLTETGGGVIYDGVPLPGTDVRVVDGEIHLRSPTLLRAYRDGTDPRLPGGWLPTGDAGELGPDGVLSIHGRRGDMIVTGGENVWPDPVEAVLAEDPAVAEVAVAARPDPEWGQRVVAFVVPEPGTAGPSLDGLRDLVKEVLAPHCAPRELVLVDHLPRTSLGKVRRAELAGAPPPRYRT